MLVISLGSVHVPITNEHSGSFPFSVILFAVISHGHLWACSDLHCPLLLVPFRASLQCQLDAHNWGSEPLGHSLSQQGFGQHTQCSDSSHDLPGKSTLWQHPKGSSFLTAYAPSSPALACAAPVNKATVELCCSAPSFMFHVQTLLYPASLYINLFRNLASCRPPLHRLHTLGGCSRLLLQLVVFQDILLPRLFSAILDNHPTWFLVCVKAIAKIFISHSPSSSSIFPLYSPHLA